MQCHIKIRADAKEDKNKLPRFFFSSQFYVFCLPSKVQNICSERNMKWKMKLIFETEWIYAKTQQHTTAKTVSFHIFSPFFLVEMRLFIFSIQYFLQMPLHFFHCVDIVEAIFFFSSLFLVLFIVSGTRSQVIVINILLIHWLNAGRKKGT